MASKIFMGDMPEILEKILNNLNNEFYSLYSCVLVSRHWCKISIPILWQDPFSFNKKPLFISKYFSSLGEDEKLILKEECGINEISKTLFNYARFLKVLDLFLLEKKVKKWINLELINSESFYDDPKYHINNSLFKLFIESGATLRKLDLGFSKSLELKPEIFYTLGENKQFFSRIQHLSLNEISDDNIESAITLLRALAKHATKLSTLIIDGVDYYYYETQLVHVLINIIKSQEQLKLFSIEGYDYPKEFHGIISALDSQKNSLQEVRVEFCIFNTEFDVLNNCKNLETFYIKCCDTKLSNILDCKISTLKIIDHPYDAQPIALIIEKSGSLLQRLSIEASIIDEIFWEESVLLEAIKSFCPNITYLNINNFEFSTQLVKLIDNLQKLQFLSLLCIVDEIPEEELKIRVIQFAEILPSTLQYFDLGDNWLEPYIDVLFNHCNSPLKKILIYRLGDEKNTKALIEFCARTRTLNYVGVERNLVLDDKIRKEVESYVALVPYERIVVDC
ncbi:hypothetical protein C2G38_2155421 [Gigaspora rosea]|uniref:Uncharacterized protein n=1 Tax=Gigaspora rosea TaxID=44941 RepID=A0A397W5K2_9GLOM|nr:hypothetical protein C2G38_2155421 [Gigaspora rosea]